MVMSCEKVAVIASFLKDRTRNEILWWCTKSGLISLINSLNFLSINEEFPKTYAVYELELKWV